MFIIKQRLFIVPMLCVGMPPVTLLRHAPLERRLIHSHAGAWEREEHIISIRKAQKHEERIYWQHYAR
jgi:hypothetical protein